MYSNGQQFLPGSAKKKSGELWSSNNQDLDVHFDSPKSTYSEHHISAPRGRCRLKFSHALENDQGMLAHMPRCSCHFLRSSASNVLLALHANYHIAVQI